MSLLRGKKNWIFDMDGTLTKHTHDFAAIRKELGIPEGADILRYLDALPEELASPRRARLLEWELENAGHARPADGVEHLLGRLADAGSRLGILTRNSFEIARVTLENAGLSHYFPEETLLGREAAPPKPSPEGIHFLLRNWGAQPDQAVMVGDFRYDLEAGRAAGTATVYVDETGAFPWRQHADVSVQSLGTLLDML